MRYMILLLSVLAPMCAFGESSDDSREAVRAIVRELAAATRSGDAATWDRYMAPNFVFTNPVGEVHNAKQATEGLRSGRLKFVSVEIGEMQIELYGDTAVVSFDTTQEVAEGSPPYGGRVQWTDTFVKLGGRWMIVARHGSLRR